jgi:hypothetical protein
VGELAIARAAAMLKAKGRDIELKPIRCNPDEAGLIGGVNLAPSWVLRGHDAMLAVDIGGSNIRAGTVEFKFKKASDQAKCAVADFELWRYAELKEQPSRDEAVEHVAEMLRTLAERAVKSKLKLAPFVGIGCPMDPAGSSSQMGWLHLDDPRQRARKAHAQAPGARRTPRLHRQGAGRTQPMEQRALDGLAAGEAGAGRRGELRSGHRRPLSSRHQVPALAPGQAAGSMHLRADRARGAPGEARRGAAPGLGRCAPKLRKVWTGGDHDQDHPRARDRHR